MKRKLLIIVILLLIVTTGCGKKQETIDNSKTKVEEKKEQNENTIIDNKEPGVVNEKTYDEVTIKEISFQYDGTYTTMSFVILNTTDNNIILNEFDVELLDSTGNLIGTFNGYYGKEIIKQQSKSISLEIKEDYSKATEANFVFNNLVKE